MSYVPRRTSTPIALCVIFRVAVIFDLHCLSAVPPHHRPRLRVSAHRLDPVNVPGGLVRLAAEMGRFAQCDASADRRTPLGARWAGGKDRRIHRVLVTPSRVARANRVTSAGSVARCPPAIDSNACLLYTSPS